MRLKQILLNILTNGVKYTKEGYILFQIGCEIEEEIAKLTFKVEDSGIGMTEEDQSRLYTKFQRFDMEKNVNISGTGLGMAITKGLVELMSGEIDVKSTYGEGTTFTVKINQEISTKPLEEVIQEKETDTIKPFDASGHKIMVVDDNKINLKVAEKLFSEYNLEIDLVDSGQECIDKVAFGGKYDLIFLDIMMPKMKGPEVLERLNHISNFDTPVIALTADVITGLEEEYTKQGFDDCMSKPIIDEELYYMLKKYLNPTMDHEPKTQSHNTRVLENAGVNVKLGLDLLGGLENYHNAVLDFYNQIKTKMNELYEHKTSNNIDKYGVAAKELKDLSNRIGYNSFANVLQEHEQAAKDKNETFINSHYIKLKMESTKVIDVLEKYLER